jgi:hypothetical protein
MLMKASLKAVVLAAVAIALAGVAAVRASQPVPLPDFEVTSLEGTPIQSRSGLPASGKWLMVYVHPNCKPCDKLLSLVKQEEHPGLPPVMVIIVGGVDQATAAATRAKLKDLTDAQWYTDKSGKAWAALKMSGVPMVFGVRDKTIEWSLSGVLSSDAQVTSILASWTAE